jgi:hypothetical protein
MIKSCSTAWGYVWRATELRILESLLDGSSELILIIIIKNHASFLAIVPGMSLSPASDK